MNRVFGLDLLRAFAILAVLYGHFSMRMPPESVFKWLLLFNGNMGVELFFVLSGFLIGGIIIREVDAGRFRTAAQVTSFWQRRWYRTLPAYYLFLLIAYFVEKPENGTAINYLFFVQNLLWPMPTFFVVSWSLAIEEWFYLLLPLPVALLSRLGLSFRTVILTSLALLLIVSLAGSLLVPPQESWQGFNEYQGKIVLIRLSSLMLGVWMAYLKFVRSPFWSGLAAFHEISALPLAAFHWLSFSALTTAGWYLLSDATQVAFFPLHSFVCALLLPWLDSIRDAPAAIRRVVTWISDISYSLYLCHVPTIMLLDRYVLKMDWDDPSTRSSWYIPVYFAASLVVATVSRNFWELPWLRLRDRASNLTGARSSV